MYHIYSITFPGRFFQAVCLLLYFLFTAGHLLNFPSKTLGSNLGIGTKSNKYNKFKRVALLNTNL